MKIKDGFILREVAGNFIVVAVGDKSMDLNGIINTNETGAFIWNMLLEDTTTDAVCRALTEEYDVSIDIVKSDVDAFIAKLRDAELIEE